MSALSKDFLESIGITLDDTTYQLFDNHFAETLNDRVIDSVIDSLTDEQLAQFPHMQQMPEEERWQWVQANVPELGDIVQDEVDILLGELAESAEHI